MLLCLGRLLVLRRPVNGVAYLSSREIFLLCGLDRACVHLHRTADPASDD
jgi:hypothetical protein